MTKLFVVKSVDKVVPIIPLSKTDFLAWHSSQAARIKNIIVSNGFSAKPNTFCLVHDNNGNLAKVLLGIENPDDFFAFGVLPPVLPAGCYQIDEANFTPLQLEHAAIGWGMGSYQFKQYKQLKDFKAKLVCHKEKYDLPHLNRTIEAIFLVRDLINTPASDLYPEKIAETAANLAKEFKADLKIIKDDELAAKFPAVYAVGRGSERKPLLLDMHYGDASDPKVVLVGKGVCFDSGGLQLKSSAGMLLMKKDMAGAAHVLGLAQMIMSARLPINLRVIIPLVENLISGNSYKPGDIIKTRKGLTIEVANTDAEGRLILADALTYASEWQPKLIIDFATLTGAARVALGQEITALFSNSEPLIQELMTSLHEEHEPVWRLPLYQPYLELLKSEIADLRNVVASDTTGGGAITAALILQQFIAKDIAWAHFDMNAYNNSTKPGRPKGGEACCLRGVFRYLEQEVFDAKEIR